MRIALLMAASLLATTACGGREAQDQTTETDAGTTETDAAGAFAEQPPAAPQFAQMVAMSDMFEIESANLALKQAEGTPTREFAQMMVADHTRSTQALKDAVAASGQTLTMPAQLDAEHQAQIDTLKGLKGAEFDREYLAQQTAAHRKALSLLKAYGGNGDTAELRQFAQATIPAVQMHAEWLDNNSPSPSATGGTPGATMDATPAP